MEHSDQEERAGGAAGTPRGDEGGGVDVQALADRVYRLMLAEARLERARGALDQRRRS